MPTLSAGHRENITILPSVEETAKFNMVETDRQLEATGTLTPDSQSLIS